MGTSTSRVPIVEDSAAIRYAVTIPVFASLVPMFSALAHAARIRRWQPALERSRSPKRIAIVATGCLTGGPNALAAVLPAIPSNLPRPSVNEVPALPRIADAIVHWIGEGRIATTDPRDPRSGTKT